MLTSTGNPRILAARKLRRRSGRRAAGGFLIDGPTLLAEALAAGVEVTDVFVTEGGTSGGAVEAARAAGAQVIEVSRHVARTLADTVTPPGVVAVARLPRAGLQDIPRDSDLVLVLDEVRDPGNAGTLMRSSLAAGGAAAVFTAGSVDPYSSKTIRSAAGAGFGLCTVTDVTIEETAAGLRARGFTLLGTDANGDVAVQDIDLTAPLALVLGNESWGLPAGHEAVVDELARIPMPGPVESLNVAVAGSIVLFEAVRQRRVSSSSP